MFKSLLREVVLFGACAVLTGTILLILMDAVIMPYVVRKGRQVEVPDIVDLTPAQARRKLARHGLRLKLQEPRFDASVPEGRLVFQGPAAFSLVKSGRTVYAVPSLGIRLYEVPDLRGRSLRQARLWVEQSGLAVGEISEEASGKVKEGLVVRQVPAAGRGVAADTPVSLVISNGPPGEVVVVPNVVGRRLEDARSDLAEVGLEVKDIRYEFSTKYLPNTVIRQVPKAAEEAKRGTGIRLVMSKL